eukprot:4840155-Prymnesium_polylepis.1
MPPVALEPCRQQGRGLGSASAPRSPPRACCAVFADVASRAGSRAEASARLACALWVRCFDPCTVVRYGLESEVIQRYVGHGERLIRRDSGVEGGGGEISTRTCAGARSHRPVPPQSAPDHPGATTLALRSVR